MPVNSNSEVLDHDSVDAVRIVRVERALQELLPGIEQPDVVDVHAFRTQLALELNRMKSRLTDGEVRQQHILRIFDLHGDVHARHGHAAAKDDDVIAIVGRATERDVRHPVTDAELLGEAVRAWLNHDGRARAQRRDRGLKLRHRRHRHDVAGRRRQRGRRRRRHRGQCAGRVGQDGEERRCGMSIERSRHCCSETFCSAFVGFPRRTQARTASEVPLRISRQIAIGFAGAQLARNNDVTGRPKLARRVRCLEIEQRVIQNRISDCSAQTILPTRKNCSDSSKI